MSHLVARALVGGELPAGFERRRVELGPGEMRPTEPGEWAGALVLVERGAVEVECLAGGSRTFVQGDLLALGWLPLRALRNPGSQPVRLVAVRRRGRRSSTEYVRVSRNPGDRLGCG